jgi:16S rRNA (adenine1518-N6/adenine1519-N6)-dimethyltransferase
MDDTQRLAALNALPPLREIVATGGLQARKALGQHFLFDQNLTDRIAREAGPLESDVIVEIGPGPGGLTRSLIREGARELVLIEKDARFVDALTTLTDIAGPKARIIQSDALQIGLDTLTGDGRKLRVAANLPYNVGTQMLINWLLGPPVWASLTLMFQREVAERVLAEPESHSYGRLAILASLRAKAHWVMGVPAAAFTPPPKVESAVIRLEPRTDAYPHIRQLGAITHAAFSQRRKMLRRSLKAVFSDVDAALAACDIDPTCRPETLEPARFAALADYAVSPRSD